MPIFRTLVNALGDVSSTFIEAAKLAVPGATSSYSRLIPLGSGHAISTDWSKIDQTNKYAWQQSGGLSTTSPLVFELGGLIPSFCRLTGFTCSIDPTDGHASIPATRPRVVIARMPRISSPITSWSELSEVNDGAASVAAYNAAHYVSSSSLNIAASWNEAYEHALIIYGEGGAGAIAGLTVNSVVVTIAPY